jgi:hypothetical protein
MGVWKNIIGLIGNTLQLNFTGPKIVGSSTDTVTITDNADSDGKIVAVTANHENIEIYDGAARKTTVTMATGGAGDITMVLPNNDGDNGNVLTTDGAGNTAWTDIDAPQVAILTLNYDDGASQSLSSSKSGRFIDKVVVKVTTAFDATGPTIDIGITGTTDKYVDQTEVDLTTLGTYVIEVANYESGAEEILATFGAGSGGTAGVAEITLIESIPTVTA